ncbi:MAG: ribbon-helix-helix protein, CopG family [Chloroflexi bacterium]|nr:ribbon-helix-helix protein, CopG family [Chloroflexota bacterium]
MKRKQIYLDEEIERQLKAHAARTHLPEAEHIRRALQRYLAEQSDQLGEEEDPLLQLIGLVPKGQGREDASINHDYYLYEVDQRDPGE